jgi:two-component system sensor kinase
MPTLWAHLRALNLAERYPPTPELAQACSTHAPVMSLLGRYQIGIAYAEKSLRIRRELNDVWGQAQSLHFHGIVLYASSRFEECIDKCRESVRLFERMGDFWEMHIARYQIAASLYRLGDLPGAVREAKRLHKSGLELGDVQASGISLDIWAWASGGKLPADSIEMEQARERFDVQATAQVLVAKAVYLLAEHRAEEAVKVLEDASARLRKRGLSNAWVSPVLPWLATSLRQRSEELTPYAPHVRKTLLRKAERAAKAAIRETRRFRNDLPHALREMALLLALRGREKQALQYINRSIEEAQSQGARYEYAQSLLRRGEMGRGLGWPDAERDTAEAQHLIAQLRTGFDDTNEDSSDSALLPATLSLVDRFDTVLDAGRKIASALNRDAIYLEVQDAALRLLRGEECSIIRLAVADAVAETPRGEATTGNAGEPSPVPAERDNEALLAVSDSSDEGNAIRDYNSLVNRALREKQTVIASGQPEDEAPERGGVGAARSAICTPIFVRGRATACFYVLHRRVAGLFAEDERRLADFIAAIAGAALENAAGFEELHELNATLEQKVSQRTADLNARKDELARSNRELEQFAYVASHDLQEPLRTVSSYCKLLVQRSEGQLDDKSRQYVEQAVEAAGRMRTLIKDLLTYSRVGRTGNPFQSINCNNVVDQALANLSLRIEETEAKVTRDELPAVHGDPTQLLQLFQNLIGNAIKFRGERQPHVHITAEREDSKWLFKIRDNGIGMEPENYERVFLIFQRLHNRESYAGTGIGLAVCKKTVEQHGGQIWVESELGQGSTFYFTLPAGLPEA